MFCVLMTQDGEIKKPAQPVLSGTLWTVKKADTLNCFGTKELPWRSENGHYKKLKLDCIL